METIKNLVEAVFNGKKVPEINGEEVQLQMLCPPQIIRYLPHLFDSFKEQLRMSENVPDETEVYMKSEDRQSNVYAVTFHKKLLNGHNVSTFSSPHQR